MWTFIKKEFLLEVRNVYGLASIFLYMLAVFYLANVGLELADSRTWTVIYWVVVVFTCFALVLKSFNQESKARSLYYYTLVNPYTFIIAKLLYNFLFIALIHLIGFITFSFFQEPPFLLGRFVPLMVLTSIGIASLFTFVGSIVNKTTSQSTLLTVLAVPVLLPIFMQAMQISFSTFSEAPLDSANINLYLVLIGVDLLIIGLLLSLFPLLWRR